MYLHSQGGSRLEGKYLINYCAQRGYACCLIDFEGSGLSSGEFVSLGWFEKTQVSIVVDFITEKYRIGTLGIWGRSMGAVTALLYAEQNPSRVCGLVVDSPFSSLKKMVQDIAFEHYKIPGFVVSMGLSIITSSIQERIGVDLFECLDPYVNCSRCVTPVTFIAASSDGLVQPKRVNQMFKNYGSKHQGVKKQYLECSGGHTDTREEALVQNCFNFLAAEFDSYSETKRVIDKSLFNMNRYIRVKGVKNARNSKKVIPVDRKGNIKMASRLCTTKLPQIGINLKTSSSASNMNTAALRESTNMQEYKDKISGVNFLRPNLPKSNYKKFKEINKENSRMISPRIPNKILESDIVNSQLHSRPEELHSAALNHNMASGKHVNSSNKSTNPPLGFKHQRTKSAAGLIPPVEQYSSNVAAPSFLGHAANLCAYNSVPRNMGSRQNSFTNLLQDDSNLSIQNVSSSKQATPVKSKVRERDNSSVTGNPYSSNSRSMKRLDEFLICKPSAYGGNSSSNMVSVNLPSFHDIGTAETTPNDSHVHNRSDWFQFGFASNTPYACDSFLEENRRMEVFAKERYGLN